jgi:pimeloyl-ACP methyl ester carboxylesterase
LLEWLKETGAPDGDLPVILVGRSLGALTAAVVEQRFRHLLHAVVLVDPISRIGFAQSIEKVLERKVLERWLMSAMVSHLGLVDEILEEGHPTSPLIRVRRGVVSESTRFESETKVRRIPILVIPEKVPPGEEAEIGTGPESSWLTPWPGSLANEESSFFDLERLVIMMSFVDGVVEREVQ